MIGLLFAAAMAAKAPCPCPPKPHVVRHVPAKPAPLSVWSPVGRLGVTFTDGDPAWQATLGVASQIEGRATLVLEGGVYRIGQHDTPALSLNVIFDLGKKPRR